MTYITVKEASEKWNISTRRVCVLCSKGQIPGAVKKSKVWMIPAGAKKPEDGRKTDNIFEPEPILLLFNPTYFEFRDIPHSKEEQTICEIQEKFLRGNIAGAYDDIRSFINVLENDRYLFVAFLLQILIAADAGLKDDFIKANQAVTQIAESDGKYQKEKNLFCVYMDMKRDEAIVRALSDDLYPEMMPLFSIMNAKKGINELIQSGESRGIANYEIICREIESKDCPLIAAYYHLYLAVFYNAVGEKNNFDTHLKQAADILLPRGWIIPFAEYSATIDLHYIKETDPKAYETISYLSKNIIANYVKLGIFAEIYGNPQREGDINIQIGFKIVQGKNNEEIANELGISQYKVKQHIEDLCQIAGVSSRKEVKEFVLKSFFI